MNRYTTELGNTSLEYTLAKWTKPARAPFLFMTTVVPWERTARENIACHCPQKRLPALNMVWVMVYLVTEANLMFLAHFSHPLPAGGAPCPEVNSGARKKWLKGKSVEEKICIHFASNRIHNQAAIMPNLP